LFAPPASRFRGPRLFPPAPYLADASITLAKRVLRREKLWHAHREHFYQRAVQRGFSHAAVTTRVLLCNAVLVALALVAVLAQPTLSPWIPVALALLAVIALLFILARQAPPGAHSGPARPESAS